MSSENGYGLDRMHGYDADSDESTLQRQRLLPRINTVPGRPVLVFVGRIEDLEAAGAKLRQPKSYRPRVHGA